MLCSLLCRAMLCHCSSQLLLAHLLPGLRRHAHVAQLHIALAQRAGAGAPGGGAQGGGRGTDQCRCVMAWPVWESHGSTEPRLGRHGVPQRWGWGGREARCSQLGHPQLGRGSLPRFGAPPSPTLLPMVHQAVAHVRIRADAVPCHAVACCAMLCCPGPDRASHADGRPSQLCGPLQRAAKGRAAGVLRLSGGSWCGQSIIL